MYKVSRTPIWWLQVKKARAENGNLNRRMDIHSLHQRRSVDLAIAPGHTGKAAVEAEVDRNPLPKAIGGQLKIHGWKLPKHGAWRIGEEDGGPVIEKIQTGAWSVPSSESHGLLDRGRDDVEAVFVDLSELEIAGDIHVCDPTPIPVKNRSRPDARAVAALVFSIDGEQRAHVDVGARSRYAAKIDRTCGAALGEVLADKRRVIAPAHRPEEGLADAFAPLSMRAQPTASGTRRPFLRGCRNAEVWKVEDWNVSKPKSHAIAGHLLPGVTVTSLKVKCQIGQSPAQAVAIGFVTKPRTVSSTFVVTGVQIPAFHLAAGIRKVSGFGLDIERQLRALQVFHPA